MDQRTTALPFYGSFRTLKDFKPCICGRKQCIEISAEWKKMKDIRGTFCQTPAAKKELKIRKLELYRRHLAPHKTIEEIASMDRRIRAKKTSFIATRSSSNAVKRAKKNVAWHHFHPLAIQKYAYAEKSKSYNQVDFIDADFVKKVIQKDGNANGYEDSDRYNSKKYFFLPSYPLSQAKADLKVAKRTHNFHIISKEVFNSLATRQVTPTTISERSSREQRRISNVVGLNQKVEQQQEEIEQLKGAVRLLLLRKQHEEERTVNDASRDQTAEQRCSGVSRFTLISDQYHQEFPKAANSFFRLDSWEYTKDFIQEMFGLEWEEPTTDLMKKPLSKFEQALLTLLYIEGSYDLQYIAQIYGFKDHSFVSRIINAWVPAFGDLGRDLSILPFVDATLIDELEPRSYIDLNLRKIGAIKDGKDFYTETVRKDRAVSVAQQGNKLKKASFRVLTWSLPCGLNFEHTHAFFCESF